MRPDQHPIDWAGHCLFPSLGDFKTRDSPRRRWVYSCLAMAVLNVSPVLGQLSPVDFYRFEPLVISRGVPTDVTLEVKMNITPSRVLLVDPTTPSTVVELRDDGTGGDRIAADQIYSTRLQGSQIASRLREEDVFRVLVGFLDIYEGLSRVLRGNLFLDVITSEVPRPPVTRNSDTMQHTFSLVNILDDDFHVDHDFNRIARRFYDVFPDEFDFMAIISSIARFENRFHASVQNQVQGIGLPQFDNTDSSGSRDRLLGINVFPTPTFFDGAEAGYTSMRWDTSGSTSSRSRRSVKECRTGLCQAWRAASWGGAASGNRAVTSPASLCQSPVAFG